MHADSGVNEAPGERARARARARTQKKEFAGSQARDLPTQGAAGRFGINRVALQRPGRGPTTPAAVVTTAATAAVAVVVVGGTQWRESSGVQIGRAHV